MSNCVGALEYYIAKGGTDGTVYGAYMAQKADCYDFEQDPALYYSVHKFYSPPPPPPFVPSSCTYAPVYTPTGCPNGKTTKCPSQFPCQWNDVATCDKNKPDECLYPLPTIAFFPSNGTNTDNSGFGACDGGMYDFRLQGFSVFESFRKVNQGCNPA